MTNFRFLLSTQVEFGCGSLQKLPEILEKAGVCHPCVVSDSVILAQPFAKRLLAQLPHAKVYEGVVANPTIDSVDACAAYCRAEGCDGLVALGGGSAIDTAKGVLACLTGTHSVRQYLDGQGNARLPLPAQLLPLVAVPTTSGTGSEVSQYAVITDSATLRKDSISSEALYPMVAIIDPEVTYGLPVDLTIATGLDVLGHALEGLTSTLQNAFTDLLAIEALRKVFAYLPAAVQDNHEARAQLAMASMLAGIAMSHCCGTLPHGMGCPLSGHCGVPHGLAVGILQLPTLRLIASSCGEQLDGLVRSLGAEVADGQGAEWLIAAIERLFADCGRAPHLHEFDLSDDHIEAMTADAMVHGCTGLMPVAVSSETVREIYRSLR